MKRIYLSLLLLAVVLLAAACGQKGGSEGASPAGSSGTPAIPAVSKYDSGPRAGESPANPGMVEKGEGLFKTKGCSACHTWGKKMSGPDLAGVTHRRTAEWMEHQILHPEVMTKEDPISHQLLTQMMLQMPNQGLAPDEARAVIEYLKHKDQEISASHE